jgi:hypothetical protein
MSNWLHQARYYDKPAKERGGNSSNSGIKFNPAWQSEIMLTQIPQRLLFVPGEYAGYQNADIRVPYWEWARHNFKDGSTFRSFLCPRGTNRSIPCSACSMQYDAKDPRIATRRVKYFTVISLEYWYKFTNQYGDVSYKLPQSPAEERRFAQEGERVFGRKGYIGLGSGHAEQLFDLVEQIGSTCTSCMVPGEKPGKISPAQYTCGRCGHVQVDMETTELSGKEIKAYASTAHKCAGCGYHGLPNVVHACSKCDDPRPAELFDVVLPLAKRGEGKDTMITVPHGSHIEFIDNVSVDEGGVDVPLFDGQHFSPSVAEMYQPYKFAEEVFHVELLPEYQDQRVFGR